MQTLPYGRGSDGLVETTRLRIRAAIGKGERYSREEVAYEFLVLEWHVPCELEILPQDSAMVSNANDSQRKLGRA